MIRGSFALLAMLLAASPVQAQSIAPQSVVYQGERWSFGAFAGDGVNAAVLRNGAPFEGWNGHVLQVGSDGKLYLMGVSTWWLWNGSGFQESGGPPHSEATPPSGAPPGATSAGYTTLAFDSDFTRQLAPNWLGGCHNAGAGTPVDNSDLHAHNWWLNIWWARNYQWCVVTQRTDPQYGGLVLDMPWVVDSAHAAYGTTLQTAAWDASGDKLTFPHGSYYEISARVSPVDTPGVFLGFHTWGVGGVYDQNCACSIEWDVVEASDSDRMRMDSAIHNWGAGGGGWVLYPWRNEDLAPGTNLDPQHYNTYGLRVTYDPYSATAIGCTFINDVFQRCAQTWVGNNEPSSSGRNVLLILSACDQWNGPCANGTEQHVYVQRVRVWACAEWRASQCPGSLLASAP